MHKYTFRPDAQTSDTVLAKSMTPAVLAKAVAVDASGRPVLTDQESEQALRAWVRCRARRWLNQGWDWEIGNDGQIETRGQLVTQIEDYLLQQRASDTSVHQAIRAVGESLRTVVEGEVAKLVELDCVPGWLQERREHEAAVAAREAAEQATAARQPY